MFNIKAKTAVRQGKWYRFGDRLEVKSAAALLADKRYQFYIEQVRERSALPDEHFSHFYQGFIYRFAEFVQVIPESPNAQLGSFLKNGLLRGLNTLDYFHTHFDKPSPLERYALFTACVLRDISNIITGQKIYITDNKGATLKAWQPFCGPLTEDEGSFYKIFPRAQIFERINKSIRVALARQVMGENGFLWVASDLHLFAEWIEALAEDDEEGSGRLVKVIKQYRRNGSGLTDTLPLIDIEILDSPATEYADQFYTWLQDGLEDGSISVNSSDSHVHITDAGIFIETPGIFKDFAKLYNLSSNYASIPVQFGNLMGFIKKGSGDFLHAQLFSDYPDHSGSGLVSPLSHKGKMLEGVIIKDVAQVYTKSGKAPPSSPHVKLPANLRQRHQQLADFNAVMHPNNALKNR